jgi:hypothetical protein
MDGFCGLGLASHAGWLTELTVVAVAGFAMYKPSGSETPHAVWPLVGQLNRRYLAS